MTEVKHEQVPLVGSVDQFITENGLEDLDSTEALREYSEALSKQNFIRGIERTSVNRPPLKS